MSENFIIYKILLYISYLGNPIVLLLIYILLFSLKVLEEVNNKTYLPQKNLTFYIGFYTIVAFFWLPHYAHRAKDTWHREEVIDFVRHPHPYRKVYINNILITDSSELTKIINVFRGLKYIAPHNSRSNKKRIEIVIKEKENILKLILLQDSWSEYEYKVLGEYHNTEKIIHYGNFAGVIDSGVLAKYVQIKNEGKK